jgi:hypothetical protein
MAIPVKLREELAADPFYKKCCLTGTMSGKVDFHHNLIYAGRQVQEKWCILPVANSIHQYHQGITSEVKEKLKWIMYNRATDEELKKYSKCKDLIKERERLNKKYASN